MMGKLIDAYSLSSIIAKNSLKMSEVMARVVLMD